jgi:hypothetical protein
VGGWVGAVWVGGFNRGWSSAAGPANHSSGEADGSLSPGLCLEGEGETGGCHPPPTHCAGGPLRLTRPTCWSGGCHRPPRGRWVSLRSTHPTRSCTQQPRLRLGVLCGTRRRRIYTLTTGVVSATPRPTRGAHSAPYENRGWLPTAVLFSEMGVALYSDGRWRTRPTSCSRRLSPVGTRWRRR